MATKINSLDTPPSTDSSAFYVFDEFAPKLVTQHHVYGITRRGFGLSSSPNSGYSADRLGDDILAVLDALKLTRPVLVGHSLAGEELSSVGSRYPQRATGLVYLDAAQPYAYYDAAEGDLLIDSADVRKKLAHFQPGNYPPDRKQFAEEMLTIDLPRLERDLRGLQKDLNAAAAYPPEFHPPSDADRASFPMYRAWQAKAIGVDIPESEIRQLFELSPEGGVGKPHNYSAAQQAIIEGQQKFTAIPVPILAIYALPRNVGLSTNKDPHVRDAAEAYIGAKTETQATAFETGVPSARVVRLPLAHHFVFLSNEGDVLREIDAFIRGLPR